jgi:hypothetical protein
VRVLEATLKPGDKEKTHSHPALHDLRDCFWQGAHLRCGRECRGCGLKTGDLIYREPVTHWAENVGETTIQLERVELKR